MDELMLKLEPASLWSIFAELTTIPRPSGKEELVMSWLREFAVKNNLDYKVDDAGNVLILKSGMLGGEMSESVALQAHTDMVCEKNADVVFDFEKDPIQAYVDGDWIKARGTTLGGDNGIGMAMMLAVLKSKDIKHPPLECLFTVDEETGLTGAFALDRNLLKSKVLINLDSEDDGEIFVGCAGGVDTVAVLKYEQEPAPDNYFGFRVSVRGLLGGHSGDDINKGRGNANKLLCRYLWRLNQKMDLRIATFEGGNLRNAIPREAVALAAVPWADKETIRVMLNQFSAEVERELGDLEPNVHFDLESEELPSLFVDKLSSNRLLNSLYACPNGVIGMSRDMEGLVETSTNLASVKMKGVSFEIVTSQRSSVEFLKYDVANRVEAVFVLAGADVMHSDGYPGWKPNLQSEILKVAQRAYSVLCGEQPKVRAIHAGLECGLFLEKYPHLDMISIGPQMYGVHSPDERLSVSSTQKCWRWLVEILSSI